MSSPTIPRPPLWRRPIAVIRENRRAWAVVTAATYGLLALGFVIGLLFPALPAARAAALDSDGTGDLVTAVASSAPLFALVILSVNVLRLSLATIVVPSLVIPFAGLVFFGYWLVETGITLVPSTPVAWVAMIPHSLTVVIELQAYALLALGALLLGRDWLRPARVGAPTRRAGYRNGVRRLGLLALPALALLVVGALWEAYSLRYLVFPLSEMLL
ncbi:stage II sporulation protein M [Microbacterium hydrothermale]|uniref:stage II sporulation protein M n=1 Tax=Microbacterium hydrothermale TaxID=857427 RepID=UPI0010A7C27D|nr:stage II sporulation protein M [Microbacterium hydrothermale]